MKKILLVSGLSLAFSQLVYGCPYTFVNDSGSRLFLAEVIEHGHLIGPGGKATLEAPMNPEHEKLHAERGTTHGEHRDVEDEDTNGHAPFYVYIQRGDVFDAVYKIRERACGMDSVVKYSQLQGMADGSIEAGRFGVKILTPERAERKKQKLTSFKCK